MEKGVNSLILHVGAHVMQLYVLVTAYLDLENMEFPSA